MVMIITLCVFSVMVMINTRVMVEGMGCFVFKLLLRAW